MTDRVTVARTASRLAVMLFLALAVPTRAQEQIDPGDAAGKAAIKLADVSIRIRATQSTPAREEVAIAWRRKGEGLGGTVIHGIFEDENAKLTVATNAWTKPVPLQQVAGKEGGWSFVTLMVTAADGKKNVPLTQVVAEVELSAGGKVLKTITETAPDGGTIGLAINAGAATRDAFVADTAGLSEYARRRYERLAKIFPGPAQTPKLFGIIGHVAGYGPGVGYGVRHNNPAIVKSECDTLKLLGMNGLVGENSIKLVDAAGVGNDFRRVYWGGPGSGSPMGFVTKRAKGAEDEACPYDPALAPKLAESVASAIAEQKRVGAKEGWGLWWDEIGVAAKVHIETCPRCRDKFAAYLDRQHVRPADVGAADAASIHPYPIWSKGWPKDNAGTAADGLRYYYTARFATEATAQLFVDAAKTMKEAGVPLYAMQGPTPSWSGHSLDWHEFYDRDANTAFVFETSNRDPRVWQFESYLADIGRGICERHGMPMGALVKPHRGAVAQRMLALAARGAKVIEFYTYGPDYAKGDSFSQSPELLERVARASRFLAANEELLYDAKLAVPSRVAFCSPRSSEIWGRATELGVTAFEDAKWVYTALRHAGVQVDVVSEQQLAEGKLDQYKTIYVVGPNLRRDAGAVLEKWVKAGGALWTDAIGCSRDEANQPAHESLIGLKDRKLQTWGTVDPYKATELKPFAEKDAPRGIAFDAGDGEVQAAVGRELIDPKPLGNALSEFADGRPARICRDSAGGAVFVTAYWAGLTYSAAVRRGDFDMPADCARGAALLPPIASAVRRDERGPVKTSSPLVEAVALTKSGRRSVALMNWAYRHTAPKGEALVPAENLRVELRGLGDIKSVRSATLGDLKLDARDGTTTLTLPRLDEIDLLVLE